MGRGLAAILSTPASEAIEAGEDVRTLSVTEISANPNQPRRRFDEASLATLADSLKDKGVLQPVLVRPRRDGGFELIAGERRWRAAQLAGVERIPAVVRTADDASSLELALVENMAREDLNPVEAARACAALVDELGLTREEVGRRVGRSRVAVSNLMRILDLPDETLSLLETGALTEGHGRAVLLAEDHGTRRSLARAAADHGWSVRETEARARAAGEPKARAGKREPRVVPHPDQQEAVHRIEDALGSLLGREVAVRVGATGYRATVEFESLDEALKLVARLDARKAG
jgi:ParB family chromosome partitioning protein